MYAWTPLSVIITVFLSLLLAAFFVWVVVYAFKRLDEKDFRVANQDLRLDALSREMSKISRFVEYSTREDLAYDAFMEQKNAVELSSVQAKSKLEAKQVVVNKPVKKSTNAIERIAGFRFNSTRDISLEDDNELETPIDTEVIEASVNEDDGVVGADQNFS